MNLIQDDEQRRQFAWLVSNGTGKAITDFLRSMGQDVRFVRNAQKSEVRQRRTMRGAVPQSQKPVFVTRLQSIVRLADRAVRMIGLGKHGWAQCARRLGGIRGITAKWVTRSKGKPNAGTVSEIRGRGGVNFHMTNNVPYASRITRRNHVRMALQREGNFLRQQMARELQRRWS